MNILEWNYIMKMFLVLLFSLWYFLKLYFKICRKIRENRLKNNFLYFFNENAFEHKGKIVLEFMFENNICI